MPRFTSSRRAIAATTVGLVLSLSLAACSQGSALVAPSEEWVGCSLGQIHGNLIAVNGRPLFQSLPDDPPRDPVPLDLPDGWEIRATDGGQFEVLDGTGILAVVAGTTGTHVIAYSDGNPDTPAFNADGALVVCAMDPFPPELEDEG
jgi:hypothetical protein